MELEPDKDDSAIWSLAGKGTVEGTDVDASTVEVGRECRLTRASLQSTGLCSCPRAVKLRCEVPYQCDGGLSRAAAVWSIQVRTLWSESAAMGAGIGLGLPDEVLDRFATFPRMLPTGKML